MDIIQRYSVRKPGEGESLGDEPSAHMTNAQISAAVEAQSERLEAIRRKLFEVTCEQVLLAKMHAERRVLTDALHFLPRRGTF